MSELAKRNPNEWQTSIERHDKKVTVEIGRKAVVFSYLNASLYEHAKEYSQFDHVFRVNDDKENGTYYLRDVFPELWDTLEQHNFPRSIEPYPRVDDERVITDFHETAMFRGLEELLEDGDGTTET